METRVVSFEVCEATKSHARTGARVASVLITAHLPITKDDADDRVLGVVVRSRTVRAFMAWTTVDLRCGPLRKYSIDGRCTRSDRKLISMEHRR
jgi:hypothetical protein